VPAQPKTTLTALDTLIAEDDHLVLDHSDADEARIEFSTRPDLFGWGETCTANVRLYGDRSIVTFTIRGRHTGQVLQRQRNKRLLKALISKLVAALTS
jgi:hypothetical protein